uniref:Secreted protein n=1 Tax=Rhipicephalus appendiculatus TaxID=34631 RepID=A0A131YFU7_RHIAP
MTVTWLLLSSLAALIGHGSSWDGDSSTTPANNDGPSRIPDGIPDLRDIAVRLSQRLSLRRKYLLLMMQMTSVNIQLTDEGHLVWMAISVVDSGCKMQYPPPDPYRCVAMLCAPVRPCYGWMRLTDDGKLHFLWHRCLPPNKETGLSRC